MTGGVFLGLMLIGMPIAFVLIGATLAFVAITGNVAQKRVQDRAYRQGNQMPIRAGKHGIHFARPHLDRGAHSFEFRPLNRVRMHRVHHRPRHGALR